MPTKTVKEKGPYGEFEVPVPDETEQERRNRILLEQIMLKILLIRGENGHKAMTIYELLVALGCDPLESSKIVEGQLPRWIKCEGNQ